MLKIKNINEKWKKVLLETFTECTELAAHRGNWEIIRMKSWKKTNNYCIKNIQQFQILPVRQVKKVLVFSSDNNTVWRNFTERNFTSMVRWSSSCSSSLSEGYKEIEKPQCCKLLDWFEEKKAMGEARERTRMRGFKWDKLVTWWLYIGKWKGVNKNDNN